LALKFELMNLSFNGVKEKDSIKLAADKEDIEGTGTKVNTDDGWSFARPRRRRKVFQGVFAPYWILEHKGVGTGAKLCYIRLLGFAGKDARFYLTLDTLGKSSVCLTAKPGIMNM
jgi:hypothetical protein